MPDGGSLPAQLDRGLLARILGMLGSAHDGEALAAARMAERLRRDAGLTWPQIIEHASSVPADAETDPIGFCLESGRLTYWERGFLLSMRRQRYPLTENQRCVLRGILEKVFGS